MDTKRTIWWRLRWGFYTFLFIAGLLSSILAPRNSSPPSEPFDPTFFTISAVLMALFYTSIPLMVAAMISFQAINPFSASSWRSPTHSTNPFTLSDPLHFFHFAGYAVLAMGLGVVIGSPFSRFRTLGEGASSTVMGLGVLVGVRLAMRWCRHKIQKSQ